MAGHGDRAGTDAIRWEKRRKHWNRACQVALIEKENPNREDVYRLLP